MGLGFANKRGMGEGETFCSLPGVRLYFSKEQQRRDARVECVTCYVALETIPQDLRSFTALFIPESIEDIYSERFSAASSSSKSWRKKQS